MQRIKFDGLSLDERAGVVLRFGLYLASVMSDNRRIDFYAIQNSIIVVELDEKGRNVIDINCPTCERLGDYLEPIKVRL